MEGMCWQGHHAEKHMMRIPGLKHYPYGLEKLLIPESTNELDTALAGDFFSKEPHLNYCKLHGSLAWQHKDSPTHVYITGLNKTKFICNQALLSWYLDFFKYALMRPDAKLLIIGYGFRDDHINEIIRQAIKKYALKIYIIDPRTPAQFNEALVYPRGYSSNMSNIPGKLLDI
jgi:hypothetical protein